MADTRDFGQGSVAKNILSMAIPMTIAQMVNVLYNVVDRFFIGHVPGASSLALTGVGIVFPIISIITAFTNLFGMGGAPLCSIAWGRQEHERAEEIIGTAFFMLVTTSLVLTAVGMVFMRPLLYLFGASTETYVYAQDCNGVQREHNKKLNNGLPILHKVPPKRDYGRYFCIMAEKGGTSHGGLTEKLSPFFHAKKQEVNAYGR